MFRNRPIEQPFRPADFVGLFAAGPAGNLAKPRHFLERIDVLPREGELANARQILHLIFEHFDRGG